MHKILIDDLKERIQRIEDNIQSLVYSSDDANQSVVESQIFDLRMERLRLNLELIKNDNEFTLTVSVVELLEYLYGALWIDVPYSTTSESIKKWIEDHNAFYYARPHEDFFLWEAVDLMKEAGKCIVVVEDLS